MKSLTGILIFAVLLTANIFAQSEQTNADLSQELRQFDVVKLNAAEELAKVKANQSLKIKAAGRDFEINLVEHDLRSANYRAILIGEAGETQVPKSAVTTFKGTVSGDASSIARFNLDGKSVSGLFKIGDVRYLLEPAKNFSTTAALDEFVIYRETDIINPKNLSCGLSEKMKESISIQSKVLRILPTHSITTNSERARMCAILWQAI